MGKYWRFQGEMRGNHQKMRVPQPFSTYIFNSDEGSEYIQCYKQYILFYYTSTSRQRTHFLQVFPLTIMYLQSLQNGCPCVLVLSNNNYIQTIRMKKAWHIVDQSKFHYYLVDVLSHSSNAPKIPIEYQHERYFAKQIQLLPYSPHKGKNIYELRQANVPEILDWLKMSFQSSGFWLKITPKLAVDFNNNTQVQRLQYISFLFGRFLVSDKRRQYLCISNDESTYHMNGNLFTSIFKVMAGICNLWSYKISLDDLSRIYGVFFKDVPIKFKIYVKEGAIIKLSMIPYKLVATDLIGMSAGKSPYNEGVLKLNGRVFNAMANSSRQLKNYYKVPFKSVPSQAENEDLEKITNYLMNVGITIGQVKVILQVFSLVMNINSIDFAKGKKDQYQFKLREGSHSKENIKFLIGQELTRLLEIQLNTFDKVSDYTRQNAALKQELLMRIIYWEITLKLAQIINEKMCNIEVVFDNYQQFIMIEFPPLNKYAQKSAEEYYINFFNEKIKSMAFCDTFTKETYGFKFETIHKGIKEEFACDINKEILKQMDNSVLWFDKVKKGEFMTYLQKKIINPIGSSQVRQREGKLDKLLEQLQGIQSNDEYFVNYVIQTTVNQHNIPVHGQITHKLLDIVNRKRKGRKEVEPSNAQEEIQEKEQSIDQIAQQQGLDEQDFIQIKFSIFQERYIYCKLLKDLSNKDPQVPYIKKLQSYFQSNKDKGKINKGAQKVCLTASYYLQLQKQRRGHENCITKIKRQFKKAKFRHSLFANLSILYGKIKFSKTLCKKVYPIQRDAFIKIKKLYACSKMGDVLGKYCLRAQKIGLEDIKKRYGIKKMIAILSRKVTLSEVYCILLTNLRKILKKERCKRVTSKVNNVVERISHRLQVETMRKLSREYHIVVKPPPASSCQSNKIKEQGPQAKKEEQRQSLPDNRNNPSPPSSQVATSQPANSKQSNKENIKVSEPIKQEPSINSYTSNSQSNYSSYGQSTNRGIQRSQISRKLSQVELISIKDNPKFTFEMWCQDAIGFAKRKPNEPESNPVIKQIFSKAGVEQELIKQPPQELNVDLLIKQRVVVSPFFPYLLRHMDADDEQMLQKIMSHQSSQLKKPLLKDYPQAKYLQTAVETFNCILKIGLDKNSSKSRAQLINMIVKPIRQTYHTEKSNISTVFQGEPAIIADYSWDHNLIKDEIFMQFIKQIMMNQKEESLYSLASALEIITRYYYPSPKFIYGFLHFLKSLQSKNIEKLNESFVNTILFAQVYEKYKGNNVTVLKDEVLPKQKQSYPRLQPRLSNITEKELAQCLTIQFKLINEQTFEFKVRNETLSHFKRKVLKKINMLSYQEYFGVYYCYQAQSPHSKMNESKKAIDFLNEYPHSATDHLLYVKLKHYFPFSIKQVNKTRIMYLNSVIQERNLPWKGKDYESIVVLSMIFDEFEEYRISNYLIFTNQLQANVNLKPIQDKYTEMINQRGKKISQIEYFKELKEHGFLGAKCYRMRDDNPQSALFKFTKILIKPLQLCFYLQCDLMSSIYLRRIKGFGIQKGQIHLQIDFVQESHHTMRHMTLHHVERMNEFYMDLCTYIGYMTDS